jgi:hypothetical protein
MLTLHVTIWLQPCLVTKLKAGLNCVKWINWIIFIIFIHLLNIFDMKSIKKQVKELMYLLLNEKFQNLCNGFSLSLAFVNAQCIYFL